VSWSDSGARTGPHEIDLIAQTAAKNDDDAARRLYRKYRVVPFFARQRVLCGGLRLQVAEPSSGPVRAPGPDDGA
jgi:hypothetical protein